MKTIKYLPLLIVLAFSLISCDNNSGKKDADNESTDITTTPDVGQSEAQTVPANKIQTTQGQGTSTVTPPGMNPPHGEPGHTCKIPVGAPLSSAPKENPAVQQKPAPSASPTTIQTAPGMNPPHGQPGHDCKIPVGSPLKK